MNRKKKQVTPASGIICHPKGPDQSDFDEVAIYFSKDEWDCLKEEDKELYKDVMMENYQNLQSLGRVNVTPTIVSKIERGEEPYVRCHRQVMEEKRSIKKGKDGSMALNTDSEISRYSHDVGMEDIRATQHCQGTDHCSSRITRSKNLKEPNLWNEGNVREVHTNHRTENKEAEFSATHVKKCSKRNSKTLKSHKKLSMKRVKQLQYHFFQFLKMEPRNKRSAYTAGFKLKVVEYAKQHGNRAAARLFGEPPTECTIREWRRNEEKINTLPKSKCNFRSGIAKWPKLEEQVKQFIHNQRKSGIALTAKMIIIQAVQISKELQIQDFKGTASWCQRFMKRHDLRM